MNEPVDLQTALGRMIMTWAYLEAAIDGICLTLFHKFDVEKIVSRNVPRQYKEKSDYIVACLDKLPIILPLKNAVIPALLAANELANTRNYLTHGFVLESEFILKGGEIVYSKMEYQKGFQSLSRGSFTVDSIYAFSGHCLALAGNFSNFGNGILMLSDSLKKP